MHDGRQHWPAVHRDDAARLYRLALERAPAGTVLHGIAEEGIAQRAIAETIGERLGVPVKTMPAEHFGWMQLVVDLDNRASNQATRELLGWTPEHAKPPRRHARALLLSERRRFSTRLAPPRVGVAYLEATRGIYDLARQRRYLRAMTRRPARAPVCSPASIVSLPFTMTC